MQVGWFLQLNEAPVVLIHSGRTQAECGCCCGEQLCDDAACSRAEEGSEHFGKQQELRIQNKLTCESTGQTCPASVQTGS